MASVLRASWLFRSSSLTESLEQATFARVHLTNEIPAKKLIVIGSTESSQGENVSKKTTEKL